MLISTTQFVFVKYNIFYTNHHTSFEGLFELAHSNMSNAAMPKPTQRVLGEEASRQACIIR